MVILTPQILNVNHGHICFTRLQGCTSCGKVKMAAQSKAMADRKADTVACQRSHLGTLLPIIS